MPKPSQYSLICSSGQLPFYLSYNSINYNLLKNYLVTTFEIYLIKYISLLRCVIQNKCKYLSISMKRTIEILKIYIYFNNQLVIPKQNCIVLEQYRFCMDTKPTAANSFTQNNRSLLLCDLKETVPAENIFFIRRFYAIMHRTTIVQKKIICSICSCPFFVWLIFIGLVQGRCG